MDFIRFRAEPAWNHWICSSLKVWFSLTVKGLVPLAGVTVMLSC